MATFPNSISLPENRADLEALIESLIAHLDELDGCHDCEDDGLSEPWLGARELGLYGQSSWSDGADDGREWDDDGEPDLGSLERGPEHSQVGWSFSGSDDREEEVRRPIAPRWAANGTQKPVLRVIAGGVQS